jgi:hypothetical protein
MRKKGIEPVGLHGSRLAELLSDIEICCIMGWTKMEMMLRYVSLRGEDLPARMV